MIIFLNGTSSSGKSSIAQELLTILPGVWFHLAGDAFHAMRNRPALDEAELVEVLRRTRAGFHRAVAGMAAAGNDIVMDHVLTEPWRLADCLDLFPAGEVLLVGVRCPLPELERRELARGDRTVGSAAAQFDLVHRHDRYDLEVFTFPAGPAECARQIADFLPHRPRPTAFERLRTGVVGPTG